MPWAETSAVQERIRFIADYDSGLYTMTELCERFGVSRQTGYKWIHRYREEGAAGLDDRSRAPHRCPHRMSQAAERAIVAARRRHPTWGPRKLLAWLADRQPQLELPSPGRAAALLARKGLVKPRRRRRRRWEHPGRPRFETKAPNDLWTADFKGEFRLGTRDYCYPLTVADQHTRYLLGIKAMDGTDGYGVRERFERIFREVGLPRAIQTDNGSPFASQGIHGLSQLSVWWIELGIQPVRIQPSHPEQNGAHERMHRTLKAETARPPATNKRAQQRRFDRFRAIYNEERPHEALNQKPPASRWRPSPRAFPDRTPWPDYPRHFEVRVVSDAGSFVWRRPMFIGSALAQKAIGLEPIDQGIWSVYFHNVLLGRFDEENLKLYP